MKVSKNLGALVLIMVLLTVSLSYGQSSGKEDYDRGLEYATQGKFKEAEEAFEKVLKDNPNSLTAENCLTVIEDVIGGKIKRDTAIQIFQGRFHHKERLYDLAMQYYNKAIEIDPQYSETYNNRGVTYRKRRQYKLAIQDFTKAIEINPRNALAYNHRGVTYNIEKGQHELAIKYYTKAIETNPKDVNAYSNRGLVYFHLLGEKEKGCSDWRRACELGDCSFYDTEKRDRNCI